MPEMGDVNFVALDRVKNEIAEVRNDDQPRVWLVDLAALIRQVRQSHRPIDQVRYDARCGRWIVFTDVGMNALKIIERRG
jgi:hypothetical protein